MKLLTTEDVKDQYFWIQPQYISQQSYDVVYGKLGEGKAIKIVEKIWPMLSSDQKEVASILEEWGYKVDRYIGNKLRSQFIVRMINPAVQIITAPVIIVGRINEFQRLALGLDNGVFNEEIIIDTGEKYTGMIVKFSLIDQTSQAIERAKCRWEKQKRLEFSDDFLCNSLDRGISSLMQFGASSKYKLSDIPKRYMILCRLKLKARLKQDSPTYLCILLDTEITKMHKEVSNSVRIVIPERYKYLFERKNGFKICI